MSCSSADQIVGGVDVSNSSAKVVNSELIDLLSLPGDESTGEGRSVSAWLSEELVARKLLKLSVVGVIKAGCSCWAADGST